LLLEKEFVTVILLFVICYYSTLSMSASAWLQRNEIESVRYLDQQ